MRQEWTFAPDAAQEMLSRAMRMEPSSAKIAAWNSMLSKGKIVKAIRKEEEKKMGENKNVGALSSSLIELRAMDDVIKNHWKQINDLKSKKQSIISALDTLGIKVSSCKNCGGTGTETYSCGYQDECTATCKCTECNGIGYIAEGKDTRTQTIYQGKTYILTEPAYCACVQNLRIGNTPYVLNSQNYAAACVDEDGNEYTAYFVINDPDADTEYQCDWANASYVERI